jgi:hypothetical protein
MKEIIGNKCEQQEDKNNIKEKDIYRWYKNKQIIKTEVEI